MRKIRKRLDHQPFLSLQELRRLLGICFTRDRALFAAMYEFGLRASEPGRLRRQSYTGESIYVERVKGSRSGTRPVSQRLRTLLDLWLPGAPKSPWLFPGRDLAKGLSMEGVRAAFRAAAARAGLSTRADYPHILKHSRATHLVSAGASRTYIQDVLGHTMASSTDRYFHLTEAERRAGDAASNDLIRQLLDPR